MALFELKQDTGSGAAAPWAPPTFKDCVAADIDAAFFEENEHADRHTVDGKDVLIVLEDDDLREHSAHWEAGAKQNFDTGLYTAHTILYIRVEDYGPKPKIGKQLVLDKGTKSQRTYTINLCQEESGVYRISDMTLAGAIMQFKAVQDGYNYADEMHTATLAQTGSKWPFNNTPTTIALAQLRESTNYGVEVTVLAYSGGRLGNIRVTDRARNGFKLVHDGSATTVKVQIRVTGGMTDPAPTE